MKTAIKLGLAALILGWVSMSALQAQCGNGQGKGPGYGPEAGHDSCRVQLKVNDMDEALDLSDAQKAKILQMHYDHIVEMKALKTRYKDNCVEGREAIGKARDAFDQKVRSELTAEQADKYDAFLIGRRSAKKGMGPGRGPRAE